VREQERKCSISPARKGLFQVASADIISKANRSHWDMGIEIHSSLQAFTGTW
jgi:hypothetical protein